MRKKIVREIIPKENLLGCESKLDLYDKLFEKSILVFPEYNITARRGISKHTVNLLATGLYSDKFTSLPYEANRRLFYHIKKLAEKGFVSYASGKRKGQIRFNLKTIKTMWLDASYRRSEQEFKEVAFDRIDASLKKILLNVRELMGVTGILDILSDAASTLETLDESLESCKSNKRDK